MLTIIFIFCSDEFDHFGSSAFSVSFFFSSLFFCVHVLSFLLGGGWGGMFVLFSFFPLFIYLLFDHFCVCRHTCVFTK